MQESTWIFSDATKKKYIKYKKQELISSFVTSLNIMTFHFQASSKVELDPEAAEKLLVSK